MTTNELRAKFEVLPCPFCGGIPVDHLKIHGRCIECQGCGASGPELPLGGDARDMERLWNHRTHASRDAEVEALQDALFQISVRLKAERESDMDDMSWHTDMIARAQCLANQCQRIESAPVAIMDTRDALGICAPTEEEFPALYALQGKRVRLVVDEG